MELHQTKRTVKETIHRKGNWKGEDIFKWYIQQGVETKIYKELIQLVSENQIV